MNMEEQQKINLSKFILGQTGIKTTMKSLWLAIIIAVCCISCNQSVDTPMKEEKISATELASWEALDKGQATTNGDHLIVEELEGADGYFLVSPKSYEGNVIIKYQVKAISQSAVLIVLFSASNSAEGLSLSLPASDASPREYWDWRSDMKHYNVTFNNSSHGIKPFMYKNLNALERGFHLRKSENVVVPGKWYDVEIGKVDGHTWLKIDGAYVFDHEDLQPLSGGHVIFRISGTTGENTIFAKAAMRSLVIYHE